MLTLAGALAMSVPRAVLVQTIATSEAAAAPFESCLAREALPRWRSLRATQLVTNHVYRKTGEQNGQPGLDWSFLIVSGLSSMHATASAQSASVKCLAIDGVRPLDIRLMRPTPASYHPAPQGRKRPRALAFVVEFIAVRPDALDEYRNTMRASIGPAVGRLVRENQFYSMTGLETVRIIKRGATTFNWNQLHIRGTYPEVGITPAAMTRYMLQANPRLGNFRQVFERLDAIRTKPRDDFATELTDLAI